MYKNVIWWIKRDLRLKDNSALTESLRHATQVIPLLILEPSIMNSPDYSGFHFEAIRDAARALREQLQARGSNLWVCIGEFEEALTEVERYTAIDAIFSHEETGSSFTYSRDKRVARYLATRGIPWIELPTNGVIRRLKDRSQRTALWHRRMYAPQHEAPPTFPISSTLRSEMSKRDIPAQLPTQFSLTIPSGTRLVVSEQEAEVTLDSFLQTRGMEYRYRISSPVTAMTSGSRLSAHLAWGTISLRRVLSLTEARIKELERDSHEESTSWRSSLRAFTSRLHWHDHFIQRLESEPKMEFRALNPAFRDIPYVSDAERLERWLTGATGVPLVDACMRCLQATGFLNFRMRAMVVSYACHILHLSWRDIMYPLAALFYDYEPGIHISQLQMQAGVVGINTIRVYNPEKQLSEHDPHLRFTHHWVPELRSYTLPELLSHTSHPLPHYYKPMVDYRESSAKMRQILYAIKKSAKGKAVSEEVLRKHGSNRRRSGRKSDKGGGNRQQLSLF
ncbi:MAG: deoxyribodipyrimidine photo-lyase/cryptochrome family protein [Bdellovibrionota bacterium]